MSEPLDELMRLLEQAGVDPNALVAARSQAVATPRALFETLVTLRALSPAQAHTLQAHLGRLAHTPRPLAQLGPYQVESRIGAGGAGEVYRVRHAESGHLFALKRLSSLAEPHELLRFKREGELLAKLNHPNVVQVHAADFEGPTPYLVLPLCAGGSLKERLEAGPLGDAASRTLLDKLAQGLAAAHALGILHRDLKPENVLFDEHDAPQLADFGLGVSLDSQADRLTESGVIMGTPSYMAPEQIEDAKRVDLRGDVYGLGAILYHCLAGRPPVLARESVFATLHAVLREPIEPPSAFVPVDPQLEAVCLRALRKDPGHRFQTVHAFHEALQGRAQTRGLSGHLALVVTAVCLLLLAGFVLLQQGDEPARETHAPPAGQPSASLPAYSEQVASALDNGRYADALELFHAAPESAVPSVDLARRFLREAPSALFEARPLDPWTALRELSLARTRAEELLNQERDWKIAYERVEVLLAAARTVAKREITFATDPLLLEALDTWLTAYLQLGGKHAERDFPHLELDLDPAQLLHSAFVANRLAQEVKHIPRTPQAELDSRLLTWPPLVAGQLLMVAAESGAPPVHLIRAWLEHLPDDLGNPRNLRLALQCRALAHACLDTGRGTQKPEIELGQDLVDTLVAALERAKKQLRTDDRVCAATWALCAGDLDRAGRFLEHIRIDERSLPALATYAIERVRADPEGAEAERLLRKAEKLLAQLPDSRVVWAARFHMKLLPGSWAVKIDLNHTRWAEAPSPPVTTILVPWYKHYTGEGRFPEDPRCTPENSMWLPKHSTRK